MTNTIKGIYGIEPRRDNEYPSVATVGYDGVTRIERREENLGTYGIVWFDVFKGDALVNSFNALHVAEVHYAEAEA